MEECAHAPIIEEFRLIVAAEQNDDLLIMKVLALAAGYVLADSEEASKSLCSVVEAIRAGV